VSVRDTLIDKLRSNPGAAGHRIPTGRALSEQLGRSRSTVRRVLLELKRRQLITLTVGSATPERRLEYRQEHRALVAALKQRDVERARALCPAHLVHGRTNLLGF
jgi:DNA-binding FadR family transcriptional regulator